MTNKMFVKSTFKILLIIIAVQLSPFISEGFGRDNVKIFLSHKDSLRSIAEKYFDDPNLWQIIMYYNGFNKISDIQPDTMLTIPVKLYKNTADSIKNAQEIIYKANMTGAKILAGDLIEKAIGHQQKARVLLKNGKLKKAGQAARQALSYANEALDKTRIKRTRSVSAILTKKENIVQTRSPGQIIWNDAVINQELVEKERVRTLSQSSGEILFIDGSRLTLNENSLTVIGKMEEDRILKSRKTSVTLLQGDVLVYLSALNKQNEFDLSTPGVGSVIRSKEFRTSRDVKEITRFSNFDGEIDIKASGSSVTIYKNQGTKIEPGRSPAPPMKLLPAPVIIKPAENTTILSSFINFKWEEVKGAKKYRIEISDSQEFKRIIHAGRSNNTGYRWKTPGKGEYYLRIYSEDSNSLAGPFSRTLKFYSDIDTSPPFLSILSPGKDKIVFSNVLEICGIVEKDAVLYINEKKINSDIKLGKDGKFTYFFTLSKGPQDINIKAVDLAGNETLVKRRIIYSVQEQILSLDVPNPFIVNYTPVTIKGRIQNQTKVRINDKPVNLPESFSHILFLSQGKHEVRINAVNPGGKVMDMVQNIIIDLTPPEIFQDSFPIYTDKSSIRLSGRFSEDVTLRINDEPVLVKEKKYNYPAKLKQGNNYLAIVAEDFAGNRTQKILLIINDIQGPEIINYKISPNTIKGGEVVTLNVKAIDKGVGLARTGSFVIDISGSLYSGILTLGQGTYNAQGSVFIPPGIAGKVKINRILLQDHLGNRVAVP